MDREQLIRDLRSLAKFAADRYEAGETAPNWAWIEEVAGEAAALLKAQEAVKPVVDIDTWKCGKCGHTLEHQELLGDNVLFHEQYNFCPECGQTVKWE